MSGRRRTRGMTLVETLVAMAVAALLLGALQDLMFKGSSLLESSHQALEAATGAQLLIEQIHTDVRRSVVGDTFVLGGSASGAGLSFSINVRDGASTRIVDYGTAGGPSPGTFHLTRDSRVLRGVILKSMTIKAVQTPSSAGTQYGVLTIIEATDGSGSKTYPLVDYTAADQQSRRLLDEYWEPNPGP